MNDINQNVPVSGSRKTAILSIIIGVLILGSAFYFTRSKPATQTQTDVQSDLPQQILVNYQKGQPFEPQIYKITQGQRVVLKVTSDVADELHFHGYDLQTDLAGGIEGSISFTADKTGRFEFELENSKIVLGAIEVNPK